MAYHRDMTLQVPLNRRTHFPLRQGRISVGSVLCSMTHPVSDMSAVVWVIKAKAPGDHQNEDASDFFQRAYLNLEILRRSCIGNGKNVYFLFFHWWLYNLYKQSECWQNKYHADFTDDLTLWSEWVTLSWGLDHTCKYPSKVLAEALLPGSVANV